MTKRLNLVSAGFIRRKDLDFTDDGSSFRGYEYAGMPITYCKYRDQYYISIRVDYLKNSFTWQDWCNTDEYELHDEFNGTSDVDVEKLKANCVAIAKKVKELNEKVENEVIDTKPLKEQLEKEIAYGKKIVDDFKKNYKWYEQSNWNLTQAVDYLHHAESQLKRAETLHDTIDGISVYNLRTHFYSFKEYGYIIIKENDYWFKELLERM